MPEGQRVKWQPKNKGGRRKGSTVRVIPSPRIDTRLQECCDIDPNAAASASDLGKAWRRWCQLRDEYTGDHRFLGRQLSARGFPMKHDARGYLARCGLSLKPECLHLAHRP
jgi:hypothetical protein